MLRRLSQFALAPRGRRNIVADGVKAPMEEDDNVAATLPHNNNISRDATLSNCSRDLYILWDEYEHGLQGQKGAKDFKQLERGQVVSTYSKRNHV
jgi:hypothetical protein